MLEIDLDSDKEEQGITGESGKDKDNSIAGSEKEEFKVPPSQDSQKETVKDFTTGSEKENSHGRRPGIIYIDSSKQSYLGDHSSSGKESQKISDLTSSAKEILNCKPYSSNLAHSQSDSSKQVMDIKISDPDSSKENPLASI